jgi:hypothetical protein
MEEFKILHFIFELTSSFLAERKQMFSQVCDLNWRKP